MTSRYESTFPEFDSMSDQPNFSQQPDDTKLDSTSPVDETAGNSAHKRKRDPSDHDGSIGGAGDNTKRSSFKRVSPSGQAAMSSSANTSAGHDAADFSLSGTQQAGTTGDDDMHDFSALSQQQGSDGTNHQNGGIDHSDPSSTAAAALAGIYPTMTVPQPTDLSFASNAPAEAGSHMDSSFDMGQHDSHAQAQTQGQKMEGGRSNSYTRDSGSTQKPAVGTAEWHQIRKDNHKEG
jgi:bHLH factor